MTNFVPDFGLTTPAPAASDDAGPVHDVIVVGSGPAGYTAAIYLARAELKPLVFEGYSYGGALMTTTEVENFPGFPQGIQGPELMAQIREQAERFGADLQTVDADAVELRGPIKTVTVDGVQHRARAIVLSTGSAAASRRARRVTASSSGTRRLWSSVVAIPRWRRPPS